MENKEGKTSAGDNVEETLPAPRFNEETEAAALPVVPLRSVAATNLPIGPTRRMLWTIRSSRNAWLPSVMLTLAITVVIGLTAIFVSRKVSTSLPPATLHSASEEAVETPTKPTPVPPLSHPVKAGATISPSIARQKIESQSVPTVSDEPVKRDRKEIERRGEEKFAERSFKMEKKQLKRQRKETESLVKHERGTVNSDEPKPRLVGIYTERRKP